MTNIFDYGNDNIKKDLYNRHKAYLRQASFISLSGIKTIAESGDSSDIIEKIKNKDFEINNVDEFLESVGLSTRKDFLTDYQKEQLQEHFTTYKVNGYNAGFAIKDDGDIVSVHNNTGIKGAGIGDELIEAAKDLGGTKLDHYAGFLDDLYSRHGFEEYNRDAWNDEYASKDWNYDEYGRPDVVYRKLKK